MTTTPHELQLDGTSDRRWIVITENGGVSTLGRASDPSEQEIVAAEAQLRAAGLGGWLAVQSHSVHAPSPPTFVQVRLFGEPAATFEDAVAAFLSRSRP